MDDLPGTALQLAWKPELADLTDAFRARNRRHKVGFKLAAIAGIGVVLGAVGVLLNQPMIIGMGVVPMFLVPALLLVVQPRAVRRLWSTNPGLHTSQWASVDPVAGITVTAESTVHHSWSAVQGFLETDRLFILQLTGSMAFFLLAKRGLHRSYEVDELRHQLTAATRCGRSEP